ncbi:MAG: hypothetical protein AB7G75_14880 [Candidatus Binatia bacterium]
MSSTKHAAPPQMLFLGNGGNVFSWTPHTKKKHQLTWSWEEDETRKDSEDNAPARLIHMWPAWAPDGSRVACFGMRGDIESKAVTSVYAVAADGIESWELSSLSGGMPIYGNWSPRGDIFAALVQREKDRLSLELIKLDQPGKPTSIISGAPLFWSWSPRGDQLAVHVGGSTNLTLGAQVVVIDADSGQIVEQITNRPGEFRVPAWNPQDNLIAYVEHDEQRGETLFLYDTDNGDKGPVAAVNDGTAVLWSADGNALAFGCASRSSSSVFSQVKIVELARGRIETLLDEPITGFFWSPCNKALLYISVDQQQSVFHWHRVEQASGTKTELARFLPSREQMFILSFFDQYTFSHPPIAPDGSALAFAGYLLQPSSSAPTTSQVYLLSLESPAEPTSIAEGQFACWNL